METSPAAENLADLAAVLADAAEHGKAVVVRAGNREFPLSGPARDLLLVGVTELAGGRRISVVPADEELTTQAAADLLGVSRPHLVKLLRDGAIPYRKVGNRHRVRASDLLAYKQVRDAERRAALERLTRLTEDLEPQF